MSQLAVKHVDEVQRDKLHPEDQETPLDQPVFDFSLNPVFKIQGRIIQLKFVNAEVVLQRLGKQENKSKLNVLEFLLGWVFLSTLPYQNHMHTHYSFDRKA